MLELVVPGNFASSNIAQDSQIEVLRTPTGASSAQRLFNTRFLVDKFVQFYQGGALTYRISASPAYNVIQRRIVAYAAASANAAKTDYADDMIKDVVRENFGSGAITARDLSAYMSVQADASAGASVSKSFAWQRVESTIASIANMSANATSPVNVFYDVVWDNNSGLFQFQTFTGQLGRDRSSASAAPMIFSIGNRNITNPSITVDYRDEVNYAYAGGQGSESDRQIVEATDTARAAASPFNRRETFVDARNYSSTTGLSDEAAAAVRSGRPLTVFDGDVLSGPGSEFQTNWDYGDLVSASFLGNTFDCWINSVSVSVAGGAETISAKLRGVA